MADKEHVTFRAGALAERLLNGPLSAGSIAKRDLSRYYLILDDAFEDWWNRNLLGQATWDAIVDFTTTRAWEMPPNPAEMAHQFAQFAKSPMARAYDLILLSEARDAMNNLTLLDVIAVIDRAEREIMFQGGATGDATSAAS